MDIDTARELARDHLATSLRQRWVHVQAVAACAMRLADDLAPYERSLLICAAWLHDIGYAPAALRTGFHPLDGAQLLQRLDVEQRLCALVAHHTAARVEAHLRGLAAELEAEFALEQSPTSDRLWWADLTTGPAGESVSVEERLAEIARRYGAGHVVTTAAALGRTELLAAVDRAQARGAVRAVRGGQSTCAAGAWAIA